MLIDKIKDRLKERVSHISLDLAGKTTDDEDPLIVNVRQRNYTYWKTAWTEAAHVRPRKRR